MSENDPRLYSWAIIDSGEVSEDAGPGMIHGLEFGEVADMVERGDLSEYMRICWEDNRPDGALDGMAYFSATGVSFFEGQYNEEGRCELEPCWEMAMEFLRFEPFPEEPKNPPPPDCFEGDFF